MAEINKAMVSLANARNEIQNTKMKKAGRNSFSNYDYFTPEQVQKLVTDACSKFKLLTVFNLIRDEFGRPVGILDVISLDDGSCVQFKQITDVPEIKATNVAQQMGGMVTYTERYVSMTAFGIKDNSLDFDSQDNTGGKKETKKEKDLPIVDVGSERIERMKSFLSSGGTIEKIKKQVSLTVEAEKELKEYKDNLKKQ